MSLQGTQLSFVLPEVAIYTDGGCEPNPGRGGYGIVLVHTKKRTQASGGFRKTTNNRMEIFAAVVGLEMLKYPCKVTLYSDSEYLVNSIMKGWVKSWKRRQWWHSKTDRVPNCDLWERLLALCEKHKVEFRWVKGHAGHAENECCDRLAMAALRQPDLPVDAGYENIAESDAVRPEMQEGDPCRKCSTPVKKQKPRSKPNRGYFYEFYLWCPTCQATYEVESAKRTIEQPPSLL